MNRRFIPGLAVCALAIAFAAGAQDRPLIHGTITAVFDGDTIRVQLVTGPTVVRLANIDAPEFRQPGGKEARAALHERAVGEQVLLNVLSRDDAGLLVAVVFLGDDNLNGWMVKQGHAWANRASMNDPDYCVWENGARLLKRGLWGREEFLAPWEWKLGGKGKAMRYTDYSKATAASCIAEMKTS